MACFYLLVVGTLAVMITKSDGVSNWQIVRAADSYIDKTDFSKAGCYRRNWVNRFCGEWKCNIFVAHVIESVGGSVPQRHSWIWSPIGAREWSNPRSTYLTSDRCWENIRSAELGCVVGNGGHVGIVTDVRRQLATSANEYNVAKNNNRNWAFGPGSVYWKYKSMSC